MGWSVEDRTNRRYKVRNTSLYTCGEEENSGSRKKKREDKKRGGGREREGKRRRCTAPGESLKMVVGSSPLLRIQRHNGIDNVTGVTSITFLLLFSTLHNLLSQWERDWLPRVLRTSARLRHVYERGDISAAIFATRPFITFDRRFHFHFRYIFFFSNKFPLKDRTTSCTENMQLFTSCIGNARFIYLLTEAPSKPARRDACCDECLRTRRTEVRIGCTFLTWQIFAKTTGFPRLMKQQRLYVCTNTFDTSAVLAVDSSNVT